MRLIVETNRVFLARRSARLFREDRLNAVNELHKPCCDYDNFVVKIASLATLFEVNLDPLRSLVTRPRRKGSVKLVEDFLSESGIVYDSDMVQTWKNIKILRNMPPLHAGRRDSREARRYLRALEFLGMNPPIHYPELWDNILDRFVESLR